MLLTAGADPNIKNNHDETPLHLAVLKNQNGVAQALIASGGQY
jgi:ankyrin repeat protein